MKKTLTTIKVAAAIFLCSSLFIIKSVRAEGKPAGSFNYSVKNEEEPKDKKPAKKTKVKTNAFASRNNDAVKIYPDIIKREMHVVAKENKGKEISFFVFDLQGTLLHQYKMKAKDHYRVTGLKKGVYIYRVFSGDEETATGKFEIR